MSQFGDELGLTQRLARSLSRTCVRAFLRCLTALRAFTGVIATGNSEAKRPLQAVGFRGLRQPITYRKDDGIRTIIPPKGAVLRQTIPSSTVRGAC